MQPLPAYFYADASHMAGRRHLFVSDVFGYIYAFDEQVWMGIGLALATVAVIMVMFQNNFKLAGAGGKLLEYVFLLFAMLLTKGVWWVAVVFATTSFTSHMQASMAIKTEVARLESVSDIIKHRRIVPTIIDGMAFDVFFKTSANAEDQELWRRVQQHRSQLPFKQVFRRETYEAVLDGRQVVFMEQSLYHYGIRRHYSQEPPRGQFYFGKVNVLTVPCAMFVSYNARTFVKETLHRATRWTCESGLLDRHLDQVLLQTWRQIGSSSHSAEAIRADDISCLFAVRIMGMGMSATATMAERLVACHTQKRRSGLRRRRNKLKPELCGSLPCVLS